MCGIAALIGATKADRGVEAVRAMTEAQWHRGPDDGGLKAMRTNQGSVVLGTRRLSILDLSPSGHQPMIDERTGNVVAYNGEIYNFAELRSQLSSLGHVFAGRGDTEVLLIGYREWGRAVLDRLRGMFAFALWDKSRQRLLLGRDHLGIKPLYYASTPSGFVCASEVRALLAAGLFEPRLDRAGLAGFLAYGAVQEPFTIIEQIRVFPSGSWAEVTPNGRLDDHGVYWDFPDVSDRELDENRLIEEGRSLLESSVSRHLVSDVPVGIFLSSGIDSTTVAGLAANTAGQEVHGFNVSFPEQPSMDEQPIAARTAERLGLAFHDVRVDSATSLTWATDGLAAMDQPSMDGLNTYIVARAARESGLKVALSGQGGDEMFGGYSSFRTVPKLARWSRRASGIPIPLRRGLISLLARGERTRAGKIRDLAHASTLADVYFTFRRMLSDADMKRLGFSPNQLGMSSNFQSLDSRVPASADAVSEVGRLESRFYLGNTLLRDGDVFGMSNSVEIRVPMLDRDLAQWALGLPGRSLLPAEAPPKHLLRSMCADALSTDQLDRPKRGFFLPLSDWMRGPLADLRRDALDAVSADGLIVGEAVRAIEKRYLEAPGGGTWTRVWGLICLGTWLEANPSIR